MANYTLPTAAVFEDRLAGKPTHLTVLENSNGMAVALSDFGARIVSLIVPDKQGIPTDVVLGFGSIQGYRNASEPYHGVTVGRFANRIAGGQFILDGNTYRIEPNNGPNALHGGVRGFHNQVWDRRAVTKSHVEFAYLSADGEEGFPGQLAVVVEYRLTDDNALEISYRAETDKPTVINLTNHAFFNLHGEGNGDVLDHVLHIRATRYLPVNEYLIPTGELADVAATPFDFTSPKAIGRDIGQSDEQLAIARGYDHNYVLDADIEGTSDASRNSRARFAAAISSPKTGIRLEVLTTEPGLQLYTGNFLSGKDTGKRGLAYGKHGAFCLETQHYPDAPNQPHFPTTVLRPGEVFSSETTYRFGVDK